MNRAKNKFNFLQSNFEDEKEQIAELGETEQEVPNAQPLQTIPTPEQSEQPSMRKRKTTGKRSNPDYEQIGVYVKKATADQVRLKLFTRKDIDFSDLVTNLLDKWLSEQPDN